MGNTNNSGRRKGVNKNKKFWNKAKPNKGGRVEATASETSNVAGDFKADDPAVAHEVSELRALFKCITKSTDELEFQDLCQIGTIKAQLSAGDLSMEAMESLWLEAVLKQLDSEELSDTAVQVGAKTPGETMWGINTCLSFEGFLHLLQIAEESAAAGPEVNTGLVHVLDEEEKPEMEKNDEAAALQCEARSIIYARRQLIKYLRASLIVDFNGIAAVRRESSSGNLKEQSDVDRGNKLYAAVLREAVEMNLEHRESKEELMRKGLIKSSAAAAQVEIGIAQAQLARHMKNSPSRDELMQQGVLIDSTPNTCTLEKQLKKDLVKHHLERRQSREELVASGVLKDGHLDSSAVKKAFLASKLSHDLNHRHSREELQNQGIMMDEGVTADDIVHQHHKAGSHLDKALSKRPDVSELKESGIYITPVEDKGTRIKHEMAKDALRGKLDPDVRPTKDELKDRGLIPGSNHIEHLLAAHNVKHGLEHRESIEDLKAQGIYPTMSKEAHAVERDLVSRNLREKLESRESVDNLREAGIYQTPMEEKMTNLEASMTKDALTSSLKHRVDRSELETAGIYKASSPSSLAEERATISEQLARGLGHRPSRGEAAARGLIPEPADPDVEKHDAMARRQAIMASAVAAQLEHRDSREALKNKGIIVDHTPQEAAVQRAFISHILAYGLAHRASIEEITNKGILLPMDADALHEAHRQARNTLEGALAARSSAETVVKEGYLESDELMELYSGLYEGKEGGLKMETLLLWQPVADVLSSGIIDCADVEAAFKEAASKEGNEEQLTFTQFLSFIELVDTRQEGRLLLLEDAESDDEEAKEHKLRLRAKRERAAKVEEANLWSRSLTERLESFRNRPDRSNPEVRRLSKDFHSAAALELEDRILADQLARSLRARASLTDLKARGICDSTEVLEKSSGSVHTKELEFAFNRRLLEHRLARRCAREELQNKGVLHVEPPEQERLHRDMARNAINRALDCHSPLHLQELKDRGIYFKTTPKGKELEQKLHTASLSRHLAQRPSAEDLELRGILTSGPPPVTGLQEESKKNISSALARKDLKGSLSLEQTIQLTPHIPLSEAAAAVGATLNALSMKSCEERDHLIEMGILKDSTPQEAALETHLKSKAVEHGLQTRDSMEALKNKGIYVNTTVRARELEHQIIADMLNHKLRAKNRPSIDDLKAQGIYLGVSAEQQNMSKCLVLSNLRRRLEKRQSAEELMSRGILYQERPAGDPHAVHERLLCSALLSRGLSHHFNPEEIDQLKQKGIYQAAFPDAAHLKAQHNLVSSQLSRLLKHRSSQLDLQEDVPHVMEMNMLATVFEEAAGGGAEPGTGWQHTASLEALRAAWSPIADFVADQEQDAYTYFDVCDHDGDGEITFSEFLRFVDLYGINPDDHIGVDDDLLRSLFAKACARSHSSPGHEEKEDPTDADALPRLSMADACDIKIVARWIQQAELDRPSVVNFWGDEDAVDCEAFISFCRRCEGASAHAQISRNEAARACATEEAKASKETLKQKLISKLSHRPDYDELKASHMIQDEMSAAALHLECNLIAIHLKQKLSQRPAIEHLKARGILLPKGLSEEHAYAAHAVEQSALFDKTMNHDDAAWQASPHELDGAARSEVRNVLKKNLQRRLSAEVLTNKGILLEDNESGPAYFLLISRIIEVQHSFRVLSSQLSLAVKHV